MNVFINENDCLLVSAGTFEELNALTKWVDECRAGKQALWVSTKKEGVPGIFYAGLGFTTQRGEA